MIPIGEKVTVRVAGHYVDVVVTQRADGRDGWAVEMEMVAAGPLHESIRSGATVLLDDEQGFVTKVESVTGLIDVTRGPDTWAMMTGMEPRWEPDTWRRYAPGMTRHTLTVQGPA